MTETVNDYEDLLEDAEHCWRNRLIGLVVLAALVTAGAYALWAMVLSDGGSSADETQTATVERGSITNTITTSGVAVGSRAQTYTQQATTRSLPPKKPWRRQRMRWRAP